MEPLLQNRLSPITDGFGFLQCGLREAVDAYLTWQTPIQSARFVTLEQSALKGSLEEALLGLLPLTSVERRRFVFIPGQHSLIMAISPQMPFPRCPIWLNLLDAKLCV